MAAAQDSRIHALRQRLRDLDQSQAAGRDELRTATTGLMATKVELAHMRSELDAARHELGAAREQLFAMRDQLSSLFSGAATAGLILPGQDGAAHPDLAPEAADTAVQQLILPPDVVRVARAEQFATGDRRAFEAFAETDLDDLTGILSVSAMVEHAREMERRLTGGKADATAREADDGDEVASSAA